MHQLTPLRGYRGKERDPDGGIVVKPGEPGKPSSFRRVPQPAPGMEMALERPEIRFDTIACSTGIETVEKARGSV
jgi:hypothetical protein